MVFQIGLKVNWSTRNFFAIFSYPIVHENPLGKTISNLSRCFLYNRARWLS